MENFIFLSNLNFILLEDFAGYAIIVLIVLIALFLILREVNCWYWKINRRIELMEEQNKLLNQLLNNPSPNKTNYSGNTNKTTTSNNNKSEEIATGIKEKVRDKKQKTEKCPACGFDNLEDAIVCQDCGLTLK